MQAPDRAPNPLPKLVGITTVVILALCIGSIAYSVIDRFGARRDMLIAERSVDRVHDGAEHVIYLGGIVLERNRHSVAGGAMGCAVGAILGAGAATTAGLFTAGAGLAAIPMASAVGCGLVGLGGIAVGYPLDDYAAL